MTNGIRQIPGNFSTETRQIPAAHARFTLSLLTAATHQARIEGRASVLSSPPPPSPFLDRLVLFILSIRCNYRETSAAVVDARDSGYLYFQRRCVTRTHTHARARGAYASRPPPRPVREDERKKRNGRTTRHDADQPRGGEAAPGCVKIIRARARERECQLERTAENPVAIPLMRGMRDPRTCPARKERSRHGECSGEEFHAMVKSRVKSIVATTLKNQRVDHETTRWPTDRQ